MRKSKSTNGRLTCGKRVLSHLAHLGPNDGGEEEKRRENKKKGESKARGSTFSLDFRVIGSSSLGGARRKANPLRESFA